MRLQVVNQSIKLLRRVNQHALIVFYVLVLLVSCGNNEEPLPELSAEEILQKSAETMGNLPGFRFNIDRDGALAYLDPGQTLAFGSGIGDYVAPDRARAQVSVIGPGLITKVNVISVGAVQWETNVITGVWTELPPNWGFNPTVIFDPEIGLQAILTEDTISISVLEPTEIEDGPDKKLYALAGKISGERVYQMSGFLIGPDQLDFELWVDPDSFELIRVLVTDPPNEGSDVDEPSLWQLDFSNFGEVVEIEPPDLEAES